MHTFLALLENPFNFAAFIAAVALVVIVFAFNLGFLAAKLSMRSEVKRLQEDSVKRSKAVTYGLMGEQIAPFLPGFPCNPADVRFVGKPVDFVAFPGIARGDAIEEVLLIEVKTGSAKLSEREREIKAAVERGSVRYVVYRAP